MRICIVGNSHLASVKRAWTPDFSKRNSFEPTFFGAHQHALERVHAIDGKFVTHDAAVHRTLALTTGLPDPQLEIGSFDCFFVHALLNPNWVLPCTLRLARHCEKHNVYVSSGVVRAVTQENYARSLLAHVIGLIRSASDAPVYASPQPYRSVAVLDDPVGSRPYLGIEKVDDYSGPDFSSAFESIVGEAASAHGFELMSQPAVTLCGRCFTAQQFCVGSVRLTGGAEPHPVNEYGHMNTEYGKLVLDDLERRISRSSRGVGVHWSS